MSPDLVSVWLVDTRVPESVLPCLDHLLDDEERGRARACRRDTDRRRYVVAHAAARNIVAGGLGLTGHEVRWVRGAHGKPALAPPVGGMQVNLSHSDDLCLVALSASRPVGVDIQQLSPTVDATALARRYFPADEAGSVAGEGGAEVFAELWTRKEALVKAAGDRLTRGLSVPVAGRTPMIVNFSTGDRYRLADLTAPQGFRAAVALAGADPFEIVTYDWRPPAE